MRFKDLFYLIILHFILIFFISCDKDKKALTGYTVIEKWKDGKKTAVSLTYDGGTTNQFKVALPIMDRLGFPATFFIVTGEVEGSRYERHFIGRPLEEIVRESAEVPTNVDNFFERASAIRVLGDEEIIEYHTRAGDLWETGKFNEAYQQIDEAYTLVRAMPGSPRFHNNQLKSGATWDELKLYANQGHEFASHSVSHAQFGILDDENLIYELEKSKEEIVNHLGPAHTFSIECPYGTENDRVVEFTFDRYEAARNRMPEPFLEEINRWNKMHPGTSGKEYVQWQRGPKSATPSKEMISWIDTSIAHDNIWLVLVFHGIEGVGWEPVPAEVIEEYFNYIKSKEADIWMVTFQDATKYIRERMNAKVKHEMEGDIIRIRLSHDLDKELYNIPLTLKTYLPIKWKAAEAIQGERSLTQIVESDESGNYLIYDAYPNEEDIVIFKQ